jgi:hypothetical protein
VDSEDTLRRIQDRLGQGATAARVIEELLPRTPDEAVSWARRLPAWDEYRGPYQGQAVALARVVSRRAMRAFGLAFSEDGRVVDRPREGRPWPAPIPVQTFRLAAGGEELVVEFTPAYFPGGGTDHFSFVSPHQPARPHCLSETGYLSQFAPHDAVEACGGARAYAALFAEARLRGEEKAFNALFEGEWPQEKRPRRKKAPPPPPPGAGEGRPPVLGEHTARVVGGQEPPKPGEGPPRQGMLFD